jgi:hypothetical protein
MWRPMPPLLFRTMLKVGAVRYDAASKLLRIVIKATDLEVQTVRITREQLGLVESIPVDEREIITMHLEMFSQGDTDLWEQVGSVEARSAQRWAFTDACLVLV